MRPFVNRICSKLTTLGSSLHQVDQWAQQKVGYHAHAMALHFLYYNFVRIRQTLRTTPAMAAGSLAVFANERRNGNDRCLREAKEDRVS
jgi:hypothetical protein